MIAGCRPLETVLADASWYADYTIDETRPVVQLGKMLRLRPVPCMLTTRIELQESEGGYWSIWVAVVVRFAPGSEEARLLCPYHQHVTLGYVCGPEWQLRAIAEDPHELAYFIDAQLNGQWLLAADKCRVGRAKGTVTINLAPGPLLAALTAVQQDLVGSIPLTAQRRSTLDKVWFEDRTVHSQLHPSTPLRAATRVRCWYESARLRQVHTRECQALGVPLPY